MKIGGLDIGTTGCKLTVFDENGEYLGKAYRDYPVRRAVSAHETDAATMLESVYAVIREMAAQYPDIGGIGVTSFGESFVMTDDAGEPLHNAMLYTDPRGAEECRELFSKLDEAYVAHVTGLAPHKMFSVSKMMWIRRHRPEIYRAAKRLFLIQDFVVWHLTHQAQIDYSLATRTMAFDIHTLSWSSKIFDAAGIDASLMSRPVPTGTAAGTVTQAAAERTGLGGDCVIVSVSHDQVAAAVGAGALDGSTAVDSAGTVECLTPVFDGLPDLEVMRRGSFSVVPYVIPGKYLTYAFSYTGGALIRWCVDTLAGGGTWFPKPQDVSVYQYLEAQYGKDEPSGLLVLPHFAGGATPYMDSGSRGAVLGLTTSTTLPDLYRACMEGVAYEMRVNLDALAGSGMRFAKINATGGGAQSRIWMQMKADIWGVPVTALRTAEAGTVGSAMLTGIAAGLFSGLEDAAAHMVREAETYEPREDMHRKYTEIYERYKGVYQAVRPLV